METLKSIKVAAILSAIENETAEIHSNLLKVYEGAKSGEIKTAAARRVFQKEIARISRINRWAFVLSKKYADATEVYSKVDSIFMWAVDIID